MVFSRISPRDLTEAVSAMLSYSFASFQENIKFLFIIIKKFLVSKITWIIKHTITTIYMVFQVWLVYYSVPSVWKPSLNTLNHLHTLTTILKHYTFADHHASVSSWDWRKCYRVLQGFLNVTATILCFVACKLSDSEHFIKWGRVTNISNLEATAYAIFTKSWSV